MQKRYNIITLLLFVVLSINSFTVLGQYNMNMPYSRYGIGEMKGNFGMSSAMGGVGYALARNNEVNMINPASYFAIDSQSFVFNIGFDMRWNKLSSSSASSKAFLSDITNISIAFPIMNRLRIALNLSPVSDINYNGRDTVMGYYVMAANNVDTLSYNPNFSKYYHGEGGIDKFSLGLSYQILKNKNNDLAIGANAHYYFGNIYRSTGIEFLDTTLNSAGQYSDTIGFYDNCTENNYKVKAFGLDLGVQFRHTLSNGNIITAGLSYSPSIKLHTDRKQLYYTYFTYTTNSYVRDTLSYSNNDAHIKLPTKIGIGLSFEKPNKLFTEVDFTYSKWSDFYLGSKDNTQNLEDAWNLAAGMEYIPNSAGGNYIERMSYRFGFNYNSGYIVLNDKKISQFGIDFGTALPIKKIGTKLNINFEYGTMGTTANSLVKERYFKIGLSISAKDHWFVKRKYK